VELKYKFMPKKFGVGVTFNLTKVELKCGPYPTEAELKEAFNLTKVELKSATDRRVRVFGNGF